MSVTIDTSVPLSTVVAVDGVVQDAASPVTLEVVDPDGVVTNPSVTRVALGTYKAFVLASKAGHWWWRFDAPGQWAEEGEFDVTSTVIIVPPDLRNIRALVPRIRRAVEGVVQAEWTLTDDEVKDIAADAIADIMLYSGNIFGRTLDVIARDPVRGSPTEYQTSTPLALPEQGVISAQAALTYFFFRFSGAKTAETIADEASSYSWERSPNLLIQQLKMLQQQRDKALEALEIEEGVLDTYISFVAVRDTMTARYIEPWVWGHPEGQGIGFGGLEGDFRFDEIASGGGDYALGSGSPLLGQ